MAKAAHFFKKHAEKSCEPNVEQTVFYWQYGENTFPEMQLSIHKAKHGKITSFTKKWILLCTDYGHLWPQDYSDGSVANLVFQIVSLQRELEVNVPFRGIFTAFITRNWDVTTKLFEVKTNASLGTFRGSGVRLFILFLSVISVHRLSVYWKDVYA